MVMLEESPVEDLIQVNIYTHQMCNHVYPIINLHVKVKFSRACVTAKESSKFLYAKETCIEPYSENIICRLYNVQELKR